VTASGDPVGGAARLPPIPIAATLCVGTFETCRRASTARDSTIVRSRPTPSYAYQAPNTNRTCHASGLKYNSPLGHAGTCQLNTCTIR
jgi:hypothetical protein